MKPRIWLGAVALATIATFPLLPTQAAGPTQVAKDGPYILRAKAGSALETELSGISFLEGNSNLGDFK